MIQKSTLIFLVEAMAINKRIHKDIEALYRTNEYLFSEYAGKSALNKHPLIVGGSTCHEEYGRKALGMLLCALETRNSELSVSIDTIIYKGWPKAHHHVVNYKKTDAEKYLTELKDGHRLSVAESSAEIFIFYNLCMDKRLRVINPREVMNFFIALSFRSYIHSNERYINFRSKMDEPALRKQKT